MENVVEIKDLKKSYENGHATDEQVMRLASSYKLSDEDRVS